MTSNSVSVFGSYNTNSHYILTSPAANTYHPISGNVVIVTTVPDTKVVVTGQALTTFTANVYNISPGQPYQELDTTTGILITSSTGTYTVSNVTIYQVAYSIGPAAFDNSFYETGITLNLPTPDTYTFRLYVYWPQNVDFQVSQTDSQDRRLLAQSFKR